MKMLLLFTALFMSGVFASPELTGEEFEEVRILPSMKLIKKDEMGEFVAKADFDNRYRRSSDVCKLPDKMEDSQLECRIYPSKVLCKQTCMFGYTFKEGIQRKMECKKDENRWTPVNNFENCKPFVDCSLTLGPGGKYKCISHLMDTGTRCEVSCQHFEDRDAVPPQDYECNIEGEWSPELPFCVRPRTGLKLYPAPRGARFAAEL